MKIIAVSGYFDPLHVGHIELFKLAKALGDKLIVILNNDKQTEAKKGKYFMSAEERKKILEELRCVDEVFVSIDEDRSICESLKAVHKLFGVNIFANGGDRKKEGSVTSNTDIPEIPVCEELGIEIIDGVGEKIQSSSSLIEGSNKCGGVA
ncbi:MAG: adenylyltransferase/cytidyltransferase family protein [Candidatus Diapherotrites archaeon]